MFFPSSSSIPSSKKTAPLRKRSFPPKTMKNIVLVCQMQMLRNVRVTVMTMMEMEWVRG